MCLFASLDYIKETSGKCSEPSKSATERDLGLMVSEVYAGKYRSTTF